MGREGKPRSKRKVSTLKYPDANSKRSMRRANRGFKSLEVSSRKHRRALYRLLQAGVINSKVEQPGVKAMCATGPHARKGWIHTAGGSMRYH